MLIDGHFWLKKPRASPTPKEIIYENSKIIIHEHLCLIDGHFWPKKHAPAQPRKGLFMNIFDETKREAQI